MSEQATLARSERQPPTEERTWQRCPVCEGHGILAHGFYAYPPNHVFGSTGTAPERCLRCEGSGTIAPPPEAPEGKAEPFDHDRARAAGYVPVEAVVARFRAKAEAAKSPWVGDWQAAIAREVAREFGAGRAGGDT